MQILQGHEGPVHALQFSPDGETLVSAGKDGTLHCWNTWGESSQLCKSVTPLTAVAISSDNRLVALGTSAGSLELWDLRTKKKSQKTSAVGTVNGLALFPDDRTIAYSLAGSVNEDGSSAGGIGFWNHLTNQLRPPAIDFAPSLSVRAFATHHAQRLMAWVTQNNLLTVWAITGATPVRFNLKSPCRALAFAPDGKALAATADWKALTFDIERKQERHSLAGHKGIISALAYTPDGRYLMTGSWDKTVKFWDAGTGQEVASFEWPVGRVCAVAFAPDGLRAAVAGDAGTIVVWDVDL